MSAKERLKRKFDERLKDAASITYQASVVSVDEEKHSCVCKLGNIELEDVRLNSIVKSELLSLVLFPKVESIVLISKIGTSNEYHISQYAELDRVLFQGEKTAFLIDDVAGEIIFNNNAKESYITDINKLIEKVNQLEEHINDLKDVFSNWTPAPQDGGGQLKGGVATWAASAITPTTVDDIKDETIKN